MALFEIGQLASAVAALFAVFVAWLLWGYFNRWNSNLPPGPIGIPFLGSIPFIDIFAERTFAKWAKKFGPVIYVRLATHPTVVLNSYEAIYEAYIKQSDEFLGRYHTFFIDFAAGGGYGVAFSEVDRWKIHRRMMSRSLTGTTLVGKNMEAHVLEEADSLCDVIKSKNGVPFVLENVLVDSTSNVVGAIAFGSRCNDDGRLRSYAHTLIENTRKDSIAYFILSMMPWFRFIPPIRGVYKNMTVGLKEGNELFKTYIDDHLKTFDPHHLRDFTDLFLVEHLKNSPTFEIVQLQYSLKDMFAAGIETSISIIRWVLLFLITHPKIQERIHKEIDEVIGRNGTVRLNCNLPYTKAVIQETFRARTVAPLGLSRRTRSGITLMGYHIPKHTQILPNIWSVHNDPSTWEEPERFYPDRHLDDNGDFVKSKRIIPFSIGARNCIGENLARSEIFIFVVSILQKFKVCANPGKPPNMDGMPGLVLSAHPYPLIMKER